jgi:hypothetical protein
MNLNYKLVGCAAAAGALMTTILVCVVTSPSLPDAKRLNTLIVVCGLAAGWLVGTAISPYGEKEQAQFDIFAKGVGIFVSGYLVGKMGNLVEAITQPGFIMDSTNGFRALLFISSFLISMILTHCFRNTAK